MEQRITLHDSGGLEGAFAFWPDSSPDLGSPFRLVSDPFSELVEAETEPRFVAVAVGPGLDRLGYLDGRRAGIGPGHGQGDDDQQGVELGGLGEACVLHVQASGFAVAEEAFDLPAPAVGLEGLLGGAIAGDDQELTVAEPFGGEVERRSQVLVHGLEARRLVAQAFEAPGFGQRGVWPAGS